MINDRSADTVVAKDFGNQIFRRNEVGSVAFNTYEEKNGQSYSFLEFLQPQKYEQVYRKKQQSDILSKNPHFREMLPEKKRVEKKSKEYAEGQLV